MKKQTKKASPGFGKALRDYMDYTRGADHEFRKLQQEEKKLEHGYKKLLKEFTKRSLQAFAAMRRAQSASDGDSVSASA